MGVELKSAVCKVYDYKNLGKCFYCHRLVRCLQRERGHNVDKAMLLCTLRMSTAFVLLGVLNSCLKNMMCFSN